jgi:hypothetical protein
LPVPGPTSRTMSDCLMSALFTIASATPGFFRICWLLDHQFQSFLLLASATHPKSVFILKMLFMPLLAFGLAPYGASLADPFDFLDNVFGILITDLPVHSSSSLYLRRALKDVDVVLCSGEKLLKVESGEILFLSITLAPSN